MTVFQNFRQGGAAAGMGSDYSGSGSFRLVQGAFYHLMGHGIGKEHKQIRTSQLFFQIRRHLGMVFQSYHLFPHMTVMENVTAALINVHKMPQTSG